MFFREPRQLLSLFFIRISFSVNQGSSVFYLYLDKFGSNKASLSNIPSVKNLTLVCGVQLSSNRTQYPTRLPQFLMDNSSVTRFAIETAATRRG